MKKYALFAVCAVLAAALILSPGSALAQKKTFVTIGTGAVTGVYYPVGGAIMQMLNSKDKEYNIRASVESTGGSVFNINAILAGDMTFGLAQSDRQYEAVKGLADWKDKPQPKLRAVFSLHPEVVTLLAAVESGIKTFADLKGKKVSIGNPGSGFRQNAIDALMVNGIDSEKDIKAESLKAGEAPAMLQDGRIDAFFYTVGHPSGVYKEATAGARKVAFIVIPKTDEIVKKFPYYVKAAVPAKLYTAENKEDVAAFGVKATFVTSSDTPEAVVYALTKEVFSNLEAFKKLHPALEVLNPQMMLEGNAAPYHPGAVKYFKEAGLMK